VAVREQEAEREQRQRRQAGLVPRDGDRDVAPNEATSNSQVTKTRSPNRAAAARNRLMKSRSGRPRFAALASPGTGNANESVENTWWCLWTMWFVGPRQTE